MYFYFLNEELQAFCACLKHCDYLYENNNNNINSKDIR